MILIKARADNMKITDALFIVTTCERRGRVSNQENAGVYFTGTAHDRRVVGRNA